MAAAIRTTGIVLEKEDADYVYKFEAILAPINCAANVRTTGFIDAIESPPLTIDVVPDSPVQLATTTSHRGFQAVQHQPCTTSPPIAAPREINLAPLIIGGLMLACTMFHVYGMHQYYRGSIDNRVECKR